MNTSINSFKTSKSGLFTVVVACLLATAAAQASLVTYSSRPTFDTQGTIAFNSDFSDFGASFSYPGDPFTRGDVTYNTDQNLIIGTGTDLAPVENVIANNGWSPLPGDIATGPKYDMFGFDLGQVGGGTYTIKLFTSVATYTYAGLTVTPMDTGLDFHGYVTSPGEYFTGFNVSADQFGSYAPVMTHVTLGNVAVPEPTTMIAGALLLLPFGASALRSLRKR
jgi:hypothetical protein